MSSSVSVCWYLRFFKSTRRAYQTINFLDIHWPYQEFEVKKQKLYNEHANFGWLLIRSMDVMVFLDQQNDTPQSQSWQSKTWGLFFVVILQIETLDPQQRGLISTLRGGQKTHATNLRVSTGQSFFSPFYPSQVFENLGATDLQIRVFHHRPWP